jgi:putative transposase
VKAGLEKDKACVFVAIAGLADGTKVVLALTAGHRESKTGWADFLRSLVARGLRSPRVIIGDGNLGIWSGVAEIFPDADEQRCWNHKIVNVIDTLPKRLQSAGKELVKVIPYAETEAEARSARSRFEAWCKAHDQMAAAETLSRDWERMMTFYRYPAGHWRHLRTSNIVESPFAALRLRTDAAKRYRKVERATAVIWKMLLIGERSFRKLNAPELLAQVYAGAICKDGVIVKTSEEMPRKRA